MTGLSTFLEGTSGASSQRECSSFDTSCCSPLKAAASRRVRQHFVVDGSVVKLSMSDGDLMGSNNTPVFVQCVGPGTILPVRSPERRGVRRLHSNDRKNIAPLVLSNSDSDDVDDVKNDDSGSNFLNSYSFSYSPTPASPRRRILRPSSPQRRRRIQQRKQKRLQEIEQSQQQQTRHQGASKRELLLGPDILHSIASHRQEIASMRPHQRKIRWNTSLPQRSPRSSRIQALQLEDLSLHMQAKRKIAPTVAAATSMPSTKADTTLQAASIPVPGAAEPAQVATDNEKGQAVASKDQPLQVSQENSIQPQTEKCRQDKTSGEEKCVKALKEKIDKLTKSLQQIRLEEKRDEHIHEQRLNKRNTPDIQLELSNIPSAASRQAVTEFTQAKDSSPQANKQIVDQNNKVKRIHKERNAKSTSNKTLPVKSKRTIEYCTGSNEPCKKGGNNNPGQKPTNVDCSNLESSMPFLQLRSDDTNPKEQMVAPRYHCDLFVQPL